MGKSVPGERYEGIIVQSLSAELKRVWTASYPLADIRRVMTALYIDYFSRPNDLWFAGCGVNMQVTGGEGNGTNCPYCGSPGH